MTALRRAIMAICIAAAAHSASMAQDFEVSPASLEFNALPGNMQTREIVITNHSNIASVFRLRVEDFDIDEEGARRTRQRGTVPYSCAGWISVAPSTVPIEPNSQGTVRVTVSVPGDGDESRWAQIVVSEAHERTAMSADGSTQAGIVLSPEIVVNVLQSPKDFNEPSARLSNFAEVLPEADSLGNRVFSVNVENTGKTILRGTLYIAAAEMSTLDEHDILKQQITVYTGALRKFRLTLAPGTLPDGVYDFACLLDMGASIPIKGIRLKEPVAIGQ